MGELGKGRLIGGNEGDRHEDNSPPNFLQEDLLQPYGRRALRKRNAARKTVNSLYKVYREFCSVLGRPKDPLALGLVDFISYNLQYNFIIIPLRSGSLIPPQSLRIFMYSYLLSFYHYSTCSIIESDTPPKFYQFLTFLTVA